MGTAEVLQRWSGHHVAETRKPLLERVSDLWPFTWRWLRDWQAAGCGSSCITGCWTGWATTARSTGPGPRSTRSACGPGVGEPIGANPVDRGKPGSKYHLVIDATGLPLAVGLSAANTHDSQLLEQLVDAVPAVIGPRGVGRVGPGGARPSCMAT